MNEDADDAQRIRTCYPVEGDWFVVRSEIDPKEQTQDFTLQRIVLWALLRDETKQGEVICPILSSGRLLREIWETDHDGFFFVHGEDRSPAGMTWKELFNQGSNSFLTSIDDYYGSDCHVITKFVAGWAAGEKFIREREHPPSPAPE